MSGSLSEADLMHITEAIHCDDSATMAFMLPADHAAKYSFLNYACMQNSMNCIRWLLEHSAVGTVHIGYGNRTPLMTAVLMNNLECARLLLRVGRVDPNQLSTTSILIDENYTLPISKAIEYDRREIAFELLRYGARLVPINDANGAPDWWYKMLVSRDRCRRAALLVVGVRRLGRSPMLASNGVDVARLVAQAVWGTCLNQAWASNENKGYY